MDKDSSSNNKPTQEPKLISWDENNIKEFFQSIGIPSRDVTEERAGTTEIFIPFRIKQNSKEDNK